MKYIKSNSQMVTFCQDENTSKTLQTCTTEHFTTPHEESNFTNIHSVPGILTDVSTTNIPTPEPTPTTVNRVPYTNIPTSEPDVVLPFDSDFEFAESDFPELDWDLNPLTSDTNNKKAPC